MPAQVASGQISWDKEFNAQELNIASTTSVEETQQAFQQQQPQKAFDGDELARTAGQLLDTIAHEQNPKFQKSQFLGLMRQLRDGEVIVEGNKVVESDGTRTSSSDLKGKGRETMTFQPTHINGALLQQPILAQGQEGNASAMEDPNDAYFRQENAEYTKYWSDSEQRRQQMESAAAQHQQQNPDVAMWGKLQDDWDTFEATATGVRPLVSQYVFQASNPYLLGESSRTQHHMMHMGERQSMLEVRALVVVMIDIGSKVIKRSSSPIERLGDGGGCPAKPLECGNLVRTRGEATRERAGRQGFTSPATCS
jgi:peroxin-5